MADVELAQNENTVTGARRHPDADIAEVAARASAIAQQVLGSTNVREFSPFEIAVEVAGSSEAVSVHSPSRPGAVKGAVEKVLRELGLTRA